MAADTPLRQMADPTKWHVMPSRPSSRLRRPASASSHAAWSVVSGASGRTQASSRSRRAHSKRKRGVVVMDEDEYEEAMTRIIRRDFFPDNRRMENQLEWADAVASGDPDRMAALKRRLLSEMRHATPAVGDTPLTASATPMAMSVSGGRAGAGAGAGEAGGLVVGASADGAGAMLPPPPGSGAGCAVSDETSLDAFVRTTMSEDDASFKKNMAKRTAEVRKKQWWVHESSATAKGRAKHLALTAAEEPKLLKDILDKGPDPHGMVTTWKHRGKNQLHWQPELAVSADTCQVGEAGRRLLLKNMSEETAEIAARAPKKIKHRGTRFRAKFAEKQLEALKKSALKQAEARTAAPSAAASRRAATSQSTTGVGAAATPVTVNGYGFVSTPLIEPGVGAAESPLMTWGDIEGTPLVLEPTETPIHHGGGASRFRIQEQPKREALALALEKKSRKKRRLRVQAGQTPLLRRPASSSPMVGTPGRHSSSPYTPRSHARRMMSPAAASLARSMAARTPSVFGGGGDSLRAAYSGTPGTAPRRMRTRSRRRSASGHSGSKPK